MKKFFWLPLFIFCLLPFLFTNSKANSYETTLTGSNGTRTLPIPDTVSKEAKALIGAPANPVWRETPSTHEEWEKIKNQFSDSKNVENLIKKFGLSVEETTLNGTPVFEIQPARISAKNESRVLLYIHGGGYVLNSGRSGLQEALLMAARGDIRVVSVDYRLAPEFPFPAALDDSLNVYKALLDRFPADKIGIFGTSTGGALVLSLVLKARQDGLPLPGAIAAGTPWSDLTKTGDSYYTNENIDNVLGTYDGLLKAAANAYAGKEDLKNPLLSPVYGDFKGFPPVLLTTGTRDLFLSNTVRVYNKLLEADVPTQFLILEGLSHAQYYFDPVAPETAFYFSEMSKFFDKYLAK